MIDTINKLKDRAVFRLKAFGKVPQRLYDELDYVNDHGGADVLLLISDLVRHLKSQGIYTSPGYGYATCSLLCYGLGITDIDPTEWGLPFERFTNSFKPESPFWIETSKGGFEEVLQYLKGNYSFSVSVNNSNGLILDLDYLEDPRFFSLRLGVSCNTSLDILKRLSQEMSITPSKIELDEKALAFFREGDTRDIFGFTGREHMSLLKEFQPECFSDIYLLETLYRPDTKDMIPEIVRRKKESDIPATGIPEVDSILMESYGALVYQEQAIKIRHFLLRLDMDKKVEAVLKMVNVPCQALYPKGHAIARAMMGVEMAYYKARIPQKYREIQREVRISKIRTAREKIRKEKQPLSDINNNQKPNDE